MMAKLAAIANFAIMVSCFAAYSPDVFNPFSLLNCFSTEKLGAYWFSSDTPTYLIQMMRKFIHPMEGWIS